MTFKKLFLMIPFVCFLSLPIEAKSGKWKQGILVDEFLYEDAPFPECHASTIAETPEGIVVAFFGGMKERYKDVCIYTCRRVEGKWTAPENVADGIVNDTLRYACWNPVLYQIPGGDLLLFYKIGPNVAGWTGWMKRSKDAGKTWSAPIALPDGFLGPIKNKPVQVGPMLICPSSTEANGWKVHFEMSPDAGTTWTKVGPINDGKGWNAIQPSILTYPDGSLQMLCRTLNCVIAESWSKDRGQTWSPLQATGLPNNNSGTDAVTLKDGRQLLVYNHVKPPKGETKGGRTPLNVAVSNDGKTWFASLVLEDSPIGQYSYPSVIQSADGMVHIVYTWRRSRIKYIQIDPSRLVMKEIKNELWPGTKTAVVANEDRTPYKISACDWMLLKRQKLGAVSLARQLGCDGLELDMGSLGQRPTFENQLKDSTILMQFKREANDVGIKFSSVAMSGFYAQSLVKRDNYPTLVQDCIDLMTKLNVKVAFLPLGVECDLVKKPELRPELVKRLRVIGQMAEKAGVVIGIETALDAKGELALLKEIGSPNIKIYFNFHNPLENGRDLIREMTTLGVDNICQIHCTNGDKFWLENDPQINMPAIKKALDKMGYKGWLVIERSRDAADPRNVRKNYAANAKFLKKVFQPE
jgi:alpha-L-rhamnosidase